MERRETYTGFCWGNLKERDHLEDLGIDDVIIFTYMLWKGVTGFVFPRMVGIGGLVNTLMDLWV
jgi:hypothetical protein